PVTRTPAAGAHPIARTPATTTAAATTNAARTAPVGRSNRFNSRRSPAIVNTRNAIHQNTTRKIASPAAHRELPASHDMLPASIVAAKSVGCARKTTMKIAVTMPLAAVIEIAPAAGAVPKTRSAAPAALSAGAAYAHGR